MQQLHKHDAAGTPGPSHPQSGAFGASYYIAADLEATAGPSDGEPSFVRMLLLPR